MEKLVKVCIEFEGRKAEKHCDLFVGLMLSEGDAGRNCDSLIAGTSSGAGILVALHAIKQAEDRLQKILLTSNPSVVEKGNNAVDRQEDKQIDPTMQRILEYLIKSGALKALITDMSNRNASEGL